MAAALERAARRSDAMGRECLERAATAIERRAVRKIGRYQAQMAGFPAWAHLSPAYEAAKVAAGGRAGAPLLFSGAMRASIGHAVAASGAEAVVGARDPKMVYHEFGTRSMPPRPVFGPAAIEARGDIERAVGAVVMEGIIGGATAPAGGYFDPP